MAEGGQRIAADKAWLSQRYGVRGWLQQRIDWLTYALADLLTGAEQPIALRFAAGAMASRQVLLVTAGAVTVEGQAATWTRSTQRHRTGVVSSRGSASRRLADRLGRLGAAGDDLP